jgi:uncharacterized membrane protein YtjA (UPF0391 family)
MIRLAILFLIIALIAGVLGFGGIENFSFQAAQIFFVIFLVLALLAFVGNFLRGAPPPA